MSKEEKMKIVRAKEYIGLRAIMQYLIIILIQGLIHIIVDDFQLVRNLKWVVAKTSSQVNINVVQEISNKNKSENALISIIFLLLGYFLLTYYSKIYQRVEEEEEMEVGESNG